MDSIFYSSFTNWKCEELFSVDKPSEDLYDHLHTFMVCSELNALGELKVFDVIIGGCYNDKLEVKANELLSPISHLIARLEFNNEVRAKKLIGIYSKDAVWGVSSRFAKAINAFTRVNLSSKTRWRGIPFENYMCLFNGSISNLVQVFTRYMIDNTSFDVTWDGHIKLTQIGNKHFSYPVQYIKSLVDKSGNVKKFIYHCLPDTVCIERVLMLNIPSFTSKNKYKSALYFESNDKFIPRFLTLLELYAHCRSFKEDEPDLLWSNLALITELYENSNTEGRKILARNFKLK